MINSFLLDKLPEIKKLLLSHRVKSAYAFGSVCTKNFNEHSDVDLLIDFEDNIDPLDKGESWWEIYYSLKKILKREVDLVTSNSLTNPYFIEEMSRSKQPIYE